MSRYRPTQTEEAERFAKEKFASNYKLGTFSVYMCTIMLFVSLIMDRIIAGKWDFHLLTWRTIPILFLIAYSIILKVAKTRHVKIWASYIQIYINIACLAMMSRQMLGVSNVDVSGITLATIFVCCVPMLAIDCMQIYPYHRAYIPLLLITLLFRPLAVNSGIPYFIVFFYAVITVEISALCMSGAFVNELHMKNFILQKQLEDQNMHDELTHLLNRKIFKKICDRGECLPGGTYSIIMMDIDNFKQVNDTYGHDKGDEILVRLAETLEKTIRPNDLIVRWGGEEVVVLVRERNINNILIVARRIRANFAKANLKDSVCRPTLSIGCAVCEDDKTYENNIITADKAMYYIKDNGKDGIAYMENNEIKRDEN